MYITREFGDDFMYIFNVWRINYLKIYNDLVFRLLKDILIKV